MFLIDRPHVRGVSLSAKTKLNLRFRWLSEHEGSDREQKRLTKKRNSFSFFYA